MRDGWSLTMKRISFIRTSRSINALDFQFGRANLWLCNAIDIWCMQVFRDTLPFILLGDVWFIFRFQSWCYSWHSSEISITMCNCWRRYVNCLLKKSQHFSILVKWRSFRQSCLCQCYFNCARAVFYWLWLDTRYRWTQKTFL